VRCAFCHGPLDAGRVCEGCGTQLHADCWVAAGGCPTLGCGRTAAATPTKPPARSRAAMVALATLVTLLGSCALLAWRPWRWRPILELHAGDGRVHEVAFSAAGDRLVARSDRTVATWSLPDGEQLGRFWLEGRPGDSFALSPDGDRAAVDEQVRALPGGEVEATLPGPAKAWSPVGHLIACLGSGTLLLSDPRGGVVRTLEDAPASASRVAFRGDGARLAASDAWGAVRAWDVATGEVLVRTSVDGSAAVGAIFFDPDGALVVARDQRLATIRLATGAAELRTLDGVEPLGRNWIPAAACSPIGPRVAYGSLYGRFRLIDPSAAPTCFTEGRHGSFALSSFAFSRDGRLLATGGEDMRVCVWWMPDEVAPFHPLEGLRGATR
jgi:WD40 repeat protein